MTFIIAEIGVNHNGNLDIAKKLVDAAKECGADAVKFQSFKAEKLVCRNAEKALYQKCSTDSSESQFDMLKKLELDETSQKKIIEYCVNNRIIPISSPFDLDSVELLNSLNLEIFKIPSGEITNFPLLKKIGKLNKEIIVSTGMATLGEIEEAIEIITQAGTNHKNITVMHCNTEYPTPMEDVNLRAMQTIQNAFGVKTGYSDHTIGPEVSIAAVALGACTIEKHFTLDKNMEGPDHKASMEPVEFKGMIRSIRNIEKAIGNGIKRPSFSELKNKNIVRKSIFAACDIQKGEFFTQKNICIKRPGTGISPMRWDEIIGKKADKNFFSEEMITI